MNNVILWEGREYLGNCIRLLAKAVHIILFRFLLLRSSASSGGVSGGRRRVVLGGGSVRGVRD